MTKTLLVGGGLTSAVTAYLLTKPGQLRNLELCVWDKARGCGGRMSTSRLTSTPNSNCSADLGAQYITATEDYAKLHSDYYDDLLANKLLDPLKLPIEGHKTPVDGSINYVCPQGSSSLVKHFFKKAAAQVKFGKKVSKIENNSKQWTVSAEDGDTESFDAIILTMPVPQILELLSNSSQLEYAENDTDQKNILSQLKEVKYSSRYAIALLYECENESDIDVVRSKIMLENGACAKYITGDSVFRYVSLDNYKRANNPNFRNPVMVPLSVVFHTSIPFGIEHIEKTPDEVQPILLDRIEQIFPSWPKPTVVKCQKWRYSQVQHSYAGSPGCVEMLSSPLLLAGGDGFMHSNFDGCIQSAEAIVKTFIDKNH